MSPETAVHTTIRVAPAEAELIITGVELIGNRLHKFSVTAQADGSGVYHAQLNPQNEHFVLARQAGKASVLEQVTPGKDGRLIELNLPDADAAGAQQRAVRLALTWVATEAVAALGARIHASADKLLREYLFEAVQGCMLVAETSPAMQTFSALKQQLVERAPTRSAAQEVVNLTGLLRGPEIILELSCRKHPDRNQFKLGMTLRRTLSEREILRVRRSKSSPCPRSRQRASPAQTPMPANAVVDERVANWETPWFSEQNEQLELLRFARLIGRWLHVLFPTTVFLPELPPEYAEIYLRIGVRNEDHCPIYRETAPGDPSKLIAAVATEPVAELLAQARLIAAQEAPPDTPAAVRQFGDALYSWLGGAVHKLLKELWTQAQQATPRHGVRLRLCCDDPDISDLPWEYLRLPWLDEPGGEEGYIARRTDFVFSRYLAQAQSRSEQPATEAIGSLVVIPTPQVYNRQGELLKMPDPLHERRVIRYGVHDAQKQPQGEDGREVCLAFLPFGRLPASWEQVQRKLKTLPIPPSIFHFIGHGSRKPPDFATLLVGACGQNGLERKDLASHELITLLGHCESLRLIILQSCDTAANLEASDASLRGLGEKLAKTYPAVVAMQHRISIYAASKFAYRFYLALALGHDVDVAAAQGRQQVAHKHKAERAWGTPVLYTQETRLFTLTPGYLAS